MFAEWTLILFTCLAQTAAGLTLFAALALFRGHAAAARKLWRLALAAHILGGLASLLHLHNPFNALYALTQMGHSWLGREIGMVGLLGLLLCWLALKGGGKTLALLGAAAGLLLVLVMAQVYTSVEAAPLWRSAATVAGFLGTALAMGAAGTLVVTRAVDDPPLRHMALAGLLAGLLCSVGAPQFWTAPLVKGWAEHQSGIFWQALRTMGTGHMLLAVVGGALLLSRRISRAPLALWLAAGCVLVGELSGRILFFAAHVRLGV